MIVIGLIYHKIEIRIASGLCFCAYKSINGTYFGNYRVYDTCLLRSVQVESLPQVYIRLPIFLTLLKGLNELLNLTLAFVIVKTIS